MTNGKGYKRRPEDSKAIDKRWGRIRWPVKDEGESLRNSADPCTIGKSSKQKESAP